MKGRVYVAVLDMPAIVPLTSFARKFTGIAKFPAVTRDLSMVVPKEIQAGDIEKMIRQRGGKILESVKLFDLYEGDQVKEGCKSIAYSLAFRDMEKTLSDDEVGAAMKKILNGLQGMNIELRS
ncbi:MAG: Phenylalanine--tRNA ligase beta subunit [Firmicutes bacterium ADurb.Bin354]|nr:MAG: Phenylalanine--tRNA ligase beta subunit [Firmicutes bacterium ADurb.Bin354]